MATLAEILAAKSARANLEPPAMPAARMGSQPPKYNVGPDVIAAILASKRGLQDPATMDEQRIDLEQRRRYLAENDPQDEAQRQLDMQSDREARAAALRATAPGAQPPSMADQMAMDPRVPMDVANQYAENPQMNDDWQLRNGARIASDDDLANLAVRLQNGKVDPETYDAAVVFKRRQDMGENYEPTPGRPSDILLFGAENVARDTTRTR